MRVAVAGLTHLGICMSIAAHEAGLDVVAFDSDNTRVDAARRADFDAAEPGVVDFLKEPHQRYLVTGDIVALAGVDMVMIAIDTVLDEKGENDDREVVALLTAMHNDPQRAAFEDSLAVAGRSGTLAGRMNGSAAEGKCRGKTGTLSDVSALSGLCLTKSRHVIVFSILMNGVSPSSARSLQDSAVKAIANYSD